MPTAVVNISVAVSPGNGPVVPTSVAVSISAITKSVYAQVTIPVTVRVVENVSAAGRLADNRYRR